MLKFISVNESFRNFAEFFAFWANIPCFSPNFYLNCNYFDFSLVKVQGKLNSISVAEIKGIFYKIELLQETVGHDDCTLLFFAHLYTNEFKHFMDSLRSIIIFSYFQFCTSRPRIELKKGKRPRNGITTRYEC